jgi:hypothetical protein
MLGTPRIARRASMHFTAGISVSKIKSNKSLQATGAARTGLDGVGDSLLPGFAVAPFPAPVPELER